MADQCGRRRLSARAGHAAPARPRAESAELVDTLYGYRQKAVVRNEGEGCVLPDLLVGDWPMFVRIDLDYRPGKGHRVMNLQPWIGRSSPSMSCGHFTIGLLRIEEAQDQ